MKPSELSIMQALAWHGLFSFPLTAEEVRVAAPQKMGLDEAVAGLAMLKGTGKIGERDGLFFLLGHEADVDERNARYAFAERKFKRALRFFRVAKHLPFLRAAFVCNTLSRGGARDGSDIDVLVVTAPGRVWACRLFVTGFAKLLGIRPTSHDARDGICLSFFADEDTLGFQALAIERDAYLPRWLADVTPLYDEGGVAEKLFAVNPWMRKTLPNALAPRASRRRTVKEGMMPGKCFVEALVNWIEPHAKRYQLAIMPAALKQGGVGVTISDRILKFHDHDRRAELRDRYQKILNSTFDIDVPNVDSQLANR